MKAAEVAAAAFGFVSVIVSVDVPPGGIDAGAKLLATVGSALTVRVALAAAVFVPRVEVTALAGIVFAYEPEEALVTVTETVQLPFAGIVPPERSTDPPPAVAVTVPPHVVAAAGEAAFTSPTG